MSESIAISILSEFRAADCGRRVIIRNDRVVTQLWSRFSNRWLDHRDYAPEYLCMAMHEYTQHLASWGETLLREAQKDRIRGVLGTETAPEPKPEATPSQGRFHGKFR